MVSDRHGCRVARIQDIQQDSGFQVVSTRFQT